MDKLVAENVAADVDREYSLDAHGSRMDVFLNLVAWFFASKKRCAAVAFAYVAAVFCVCAVAWVPSGVNDDWVISNLLSGNWPGPQGLCLFVNAVLSQAVYFLNQAIPQFNWFYILEGLTSAMGFFAIVYLSLSRMRTPCALLSVSAVTILVLPGCTYEPNFTYVAGMAACAGWLSLLCWTREGRGNAFLAVSGVVFLLLAALWRWNMLLLSTPVFCVAVAMVVLFGEDGAVRKTVRLAIPFAIALLACVCVYTYDAALWSQSPWQEWREFNEVRSEYSDYEHKPYDEIANDLAAIGVSENDYALLSAWIHEDPEFFTMERFAQINDISIKKGNDSGFAFKAALSYLTSLFTAPKMAFVFISALVIAFGALRGRERRTALVLIVVALAVALVFAVAGRLPARVRYPLWAFAITSFGIAAGKPPCSKGEASAAESYAGALVSRLVSAVSFCIPVVALVFVMGTALGNLNVGRMEPIFDAQGFEPHSLAVDYVHEHPENVYVTNTSSNSVIMFAYMVIAPYDEELVAHDVSIGGWASRSPYCETRNAAAGLANPIKGLVSSDNAYYLAAGPKSAEMLCTYLREHYYPDARFEEVEVLDPGDSSTALHVYRFLER